MYKAKITSKGQVTIPKKILEYLDVGEGHRLIFKPSKYGDKKCVTIEVMESLCSVCNGEGHIEDIECIVCRGSGEQQLTKDPVIEAHEASMGYFKKYHIGMNLMIQKTIGGDEFYSFPHLSLVSEDIPNHIINKFNDYYQLRIIKESTGLTFSLSNHENLPVTEELAKELLSSVKEPSSKEYLTKLFRLYNDKE